MSINVIGVVGSQGKTTITHLLNHTFLSSKIATAVANSNGFFINGDKVLNGVNIDNLERSDLERFFALVAGKKCFFFNT